MERIQQIRLTVLVGSIILAAVLIITAVAVEEAQTETMGNGYVIAGQTWKQLTPSRYNRIYHHVKAKKPAAARVMVDAARDMCKATVSPTPHFFGPNNSSHPFDCSSYR
jgi:hypothetical protein